MSAAFFFILLSYSWRRSSAEAMTGRPGRLQYAGDGGWRGVHVCSLKAFSNSSTYDCRMLQDLTKAISKGLVVKDSYGKLLLERSPVIPCPMQGMWLNIQTSQRNTAAFLCVGCGSLRVHREQYFETTQSSAREFSPQKSLAMAARARPPAASRRIGLSGP